MINDIDVSQVPGVAACAQRWPPSRRILFPMPLRPVRFRPPPVVMSPAVLWMLRRAFGPPGAPAPEATAAEALALCRRFDLAGRVAARQGRGRLAAELGEAGAAGFAREQVAAAGMGMRLSALASRVAEAAAELGIPARFLEVRRPRALRGARSRKPVGLRRRSAGAGDGGGGVAGGPRLPGFFALRTAGPGAPAPHPRRAGGGGRAPPDAPRGAARRGAFGDLRRSGAGGAPRSPPRSPRARRRSRAGGRHRLRPRPWSRPARLVAAVLLPVQDDGRPHRSWVRGVRGALPGPAARSTSRRWAPGSRRTSPRPKSRRPAFSPPPSRRGRISPLWGESGEPAALLLRHLLAGLLDPGYERALRLGLFKGQPSDRPAPSRLARTLFRTVFLTRGQVDALYGPPRGGPLGYLGRRLWRPIDLAGRLVRYGASAWKARSPR